MKRRPILWICSATIKGKLVTEAITWNLKPGESLDFQKGETACKKAFQRKHGKLPVTVFGPVYRAKGTSKIDTGKVLVPVEAMVRKTSRVFSGRCNGRKVLGNGLKALVSKNGAKYRANELIAPYYADPSIKGGTRGFGSRTALKLSSLQDVRELKQR